MPRLFFALWPGEPVRDQLAAQRDPLVRDYCGRAVRRDTLHLTLLFLGETPELTVPSVLAMGDRVAGRAFELCIDARSHFREAKVAFLGTTEPPPAMHDLAGALRDGARATALAFDDKDFSPHITLARHCQLFPPPQPIRPAIGWAVEDFVLLDSTTTPGGPVYRVVRHWPLGAGG